METYMKTEIKELIDEVMEDVPSQVDAWEVRARLYEAFGLEE